MNTHPTTEKEKFLRQNDGRENKLLLAWYKSPGENPCEGRKRTPVADARAVQIS